VLSDAEKAAILDELAAADPDVEGRTERAARSPLTDGEADDVASGVTAALLALDQDELAPMPSARATGMSNRPKRRGAAPLTTSQISRDLSGGSADLYSAELPMAILWICRTAAECLP
jgi:hypothetical protein